MVESSSKCDAILCFTSNLLLFSSKDLCDGTRNKGPKVPGCKDTHYTVEMMKTSCHGQYHCKVEVEQSVDLELFSDSECYKPKQELMVEYTCGNSNILNIACETYPHV